MDNIPSPESLRVLTRVFVEEERILNECCSKMKESAEKGYYEFTLYHGNEDLLNRIAELFNEAGYTTKDQYEESAFIGVTFSWDIKKEPELEDDGIDDLDDEEDCI